MRYEPGIWVVRRQRVKSMALNLHENLVKFLLDTQALLFLVLCGKSSSNLWNRLRAIPSELLRLGFGPASLSKYAHSVMTGRFS